MGIMIISIILLVVSIVLCVLNFKYWDKCWLICTTITSIFVCGIVLLCCIVAHIDAYAFADKKYDDMIYQKEVIEYRLEHKTNNEPGNELLYRDIVEFNSILREHKTYGNNWWISAFYNPKIGTIEYIDIGGISYD